MEKSTEFCYVLSGSSLPLLGSQFLDYSCFISVNFGRDFQGVYSILSGKVRMVCRQAQNMEIQY